MNKSPKSYTCSYIYKLTLKDQSTYVGLRHCNCLPEEDPYLGSGTHYQKSDVVHKEVLISGDFDDATLALLETVAIMDNKAENPKNVNISLGAYYYNQMCLSRYNESVRKAMSEKAKARWQRKDQREYLESCRRKQMTTERRKQISETIKKTTHTKDWSEKHSAAIKEGLKRAKRHPRYCYVLNEITSEVYKTLREAATKLPCSADTIRYILKGNVSKRYPDLRLKRIYDYNLYCKQGE